MDNFSVEYMKKSYQNLYELYVLDQIGTIEHNSQCFHIEIL